ncbi:MAG: flagellar hook capping FlgD N-terminal domain-containing protein [Candidatus Contubernalis sp.]|nr:flagellar hook capping FlgD N-terminal domain-containing protein [Candidatus Contubernalis sp.]
MSTIMGISNNYSQQASPNGGDGFKELDKNAFLQLLVTQLRYQDPLNPQDNSEFMAQMAQFTSLEQLQNLNDNMEKLVQAQYDSLKKIGDLSENIEMLFQRQDMFQLSLLGTVVTVKGEGGGLKTGMVTALEFVEGIPKLMIDGQAYSLEQLVKVEISGAAEENDAVEDSSVIESGVVDE